MSVYVSHQHTQIRNNSGDALTAHAKCRPREREPVYPPILYRTTETRETLICEYHKIRRVNRRQPSADNVAADGTFSLLLFAYFYQLREIRIGFTGSPKISPCHTKSTVCQNSHRLSSKKKKVQNFFFTI